MPASLLALLVAASPGKNDLCQLIKTGHVAEFRASLEKAKLPTCDKPLAMLAVGSNKPDDDVIAMLDLLASKGVKVGQALPSGQTALGATISVGVLRALLARGLPCDRIAAIDQRRDVGRLTQYGPSTTTVDFTVSGGKVKETSKTDQLEGCAFLGCD